MKKIKNIQRKQTGLSHKTNKCKEAIKRRGAATVEFALVAPVFLTLLLGTWEMSQAVDATHVLSSAVREGGRLASMDWEGKIPNGSSPNEKILKDIVNIIKASNLPSEELTVTITHAEGESSGQEFDLSNPNNSLELFKIDASLPYNSITTFPLNYMAGETVSATLIFRAGRVTLVN